jgi:hypothetical protein
MKLRTEPCATRASWWIRLGSALAGHEAHFRGQVCMLAHQLGLPNEVASGIWNWEKLWKECGSTGAAGHPS